MNNIQDFLKEIAEMSREELVGTFFETKDKYSKYELDAPNGKSYYVSENCEYYW